jgi:hypothetical protein
VLGLCKLNVSLRQAGVAENMQNAMSARTACTDALVQLIMTHRVNTPFYFSLVAVRTTLLSHPQHGLATNANLYVDLQPEP